MMRCGRVRQGSRAGTQRFLLGGAVLAGALWALAGAPAAAREAGGAPRLEAGDGAAGQGNAIVVAARLREERLQETPIAISTLNAETLEERQLVQSQALERITPGLQFKPEGQISGNSS